MATVEGCEKNFRQNNSCDKKIAMNFAYEIFQRLQYKLSKTIHGNKIFRVKTCIRQVKYETFRNN